MINPSIIEFQNSFAIEAIRTEVLRVRYLMVGCGAFPVSPDKTTREIDTFLFKVLPFATEWNRMFEAS
jgi:hypothetical protein